MFSRLFSSGNMRNGMTVGVVKIADDDDFDALKEMCECHENWRLDYSKGDTTVWTRSNDVSDFRMVKIRGVFDDVCADVVYDVLHDAQYRKLWDPNILAGKEICRVNETSEICYYAMHLPRPLTNRDFLTQRCWRDLGSEKFLLNHSVNHAEMPPQKYLIRGISYLTGYHVVSTVNNPSKHGCQMTYVTQADPKGHLPVWVVNKSTQWLAPKVIDKLHKGCLKYVEWKKENNPDYMPWRHPEQSRLPPLCESDILGMNNNEAKLGEEEEQNVNEDELSTSGLEF